MIWWIAPLAAAAGFVGLCLVLRDEQRSRRAARARHAGQHPQEARRASPTPARSPGAQAAEDVS